MGMIVDFLKNAGEKLGLNLGDDKAGDAVKQSIDKHNLGVDNLDVKIDGDKVVVSGNAASIESMEKAILAAGNIEGVAKVESNIVAASQNSEAEQAKFYTVKSGDTLSKIAREFYGNANLYNEIFEANKPMLTHPDKIYPGQNLRIPADKQKAAA